MRNCPELLGSGNSMLVVGESGWFRHSKREISGGGEGEEKGEREREGRRWLLEGTEDRRRISTLRVIEIGVHQALFRTIGLTSLKNYKIKKQGLNGPLF